VEPLKRVGPMQLARPNSTTQHLVHAPVHISDLRHLPLDAVQITPRCCQHIANALPMLLPMDSFDPPVNARTTSQSGHCYLTR
jgi:hypothetical protein